MSIASVSAAKSAINVTVRESEGGRAGLDAYANENFSIHCETQVSFTDRGVVSGTGKSAGFQLPKSFRFVNGVVYGTPMSQAAYDALATDDLRDNACVASDAMFPVGSEVKSFHPVVKNGAGASGLAGLVFSGAPNMELPYGVIVKCSTGGAAGTGEIQCSTDGGTTFGTAYATTANALNVIKDSANNDTGLRLRLATQTLVLNEVVTIDVNAPGAAKRWIKKTPETWTEL